MFIILIVTRSFYYNYIHAHKKLKKQLYFVFRDYLYGHDFVIIDAKRKLSLFDICYFKIYIWTLFNIWFWFEVQLRPGKPKRSKLQSEIPYNKSLQNENEGHLNSCLSSKFLVTNLILRIDHIVLNVSIFTCNAV